MELVLDCLIENDKVKLNKYKPLIKYYLKSFLIKSVNFEKYTIH